VTAIRRARQVEAKCDERRTESAANRRRRSGDSRTVDLCRDTGWSVHASATEIVGFSVRKRFDDRWDANLDVYVGVNPFEHRPEVQINIETDPV
jgi:hypothetical protein